MTLRIPYSIRLHKRARKGLAKLPPTRRNKARQFINTQLRFSPQQPISGKTKRLTGPLTGIYQYHLSHSERIWWRVNTAEHIVYVLYIGPHPKSTE